MKSLYEFLVWAVLLLDCRLGHALSCEAVPGRPI